MQRIIAGIVLFSASVLNLVDAKPVRPPFEVEPPPKGAMLPANVQLAGTAWLGKYNAVNRTYILEADGSVSYSSGKNLFKQRGSWKFDGVNLVFDHHVGVAKKPTMEFRGVVKDANTIVGEQVMLVTGAKTTVTMQKTAVPTGK